MHIKKRKLICIVLLLINIICISNVVLAANTDTSDYINPNISGSAVSFAETTMGIAISVIRIVAVGTAIIALTFVAIKYMTSAPGERAEYKKTLLIYLVGAILVIAGTNIISIIAEAASDLIS